MTEKKTYEDKMTDLDAKIKALRKQKRKLQKDHEVKDLKLKLKKQSEQIAQLTADNVELKAKLSDADMSTVAFDPTPKLEEQKEKIEAQDQQIRKLQSKLSAADPQNLASENKKLNNKIEYMQKTILELGSKYGFKGSQVLGLIDRRMDKKRK